MADRYCTRCAAKLTHVIGKVDKCYNCGNPLTITWWMRNKSLVLSWILLWPLGIILSIRRSIKTKSWKPCTPIFALVGMFLLIPISEYIRKSDPFEITRRQIRRQRPTARFVDLCLEKYFTDIDPSTDIPASAIPVFIAALANDKQFQNIYTEYHDDATKLLPYISASTDDDVDNIYYSFMSDICIMDSYHIEILVKKITRIIRDMSY